MPKLTQQQRGVDDGSFVGIGYFNDQIRRGAVNNRYKVPKKDLEVHDWGELRKWEEII